METLTGRGNPKIKQARALRQRKERQSSGLFLIEGIWHIGEAAQAQFPLEYILFSPDLLTSDFAQRLVDEQFAHGIPCYSLPGSLFETLAEKDNPQGILAVARQRWTRLEDLTPANFPWAVALASPQDPGNIGAILRTIDAVGASGLLLLENSADPYHPGAVRASMGSIFWRPPAQARFGEFVRWGRDYGYTIYGTSSHASQDYRSVSSFGPPLALLMGSEREGLSAEQSSACDLLLRMPMEGRVTSLNLAVATGVMLYKIYEKWQGRKEPDGSGPSQ